MLGLSDSRGYVFEPAGFTTEQLDQARWRADGRAACPSMLPAWTVPGSCRARQRGRPGQPPHQWFTPCALLAKHRRPPQICAIKASHDGQLESYRGSPDAVYVPGRRLWEVDAPVDCAFPCATQVGWHAAVAWGGALLLPRWAGMGHQLRLPPALCSACCCC